MKNKKRKAIKAKFRHGYTLIRKLRAYEAIIDNAQDIGRLAVIHGEILVLKFHIQQFYTDEQIKAYHMMYNDSIRSDNRYENYNWLSWQLVKKYGRNQTAWQRAIDYRDKLKKVYKRPL